MKPSEPNRDFSNWIGGNIHIDALNKAIIATRVRGKEEVIAQLEAELQDTRIDKANAERHRDNTFAENAALKRENEALRKLIDAIEDDTATDLKDTYPELVDALLEEPE